MPIPLASSFLAGSLLTIILPIALLVAILVWYMKAISKVPGSELERERPPAERDSPAPGRSPPPPAEPVP
jgi:hypothetical protein